VQRAILYGRHFEGSTCTLLQGYRFYKLVSGEIGFFSFKQKFSFSCTLRVVLISYVYNASDMSNGFALVSFCGKCLSVVNSKTGGFVLSCSDFICQRCMPTHAPGERISCPACNKHGVQQLNICSQLPDEVNSRIADPGQKLDSFSITMKFQINYYQQTIKRIHDRYLQTKEENEQLKRYSRNK
jgi:hypothetical protein